MVVPAYNSETTIKRCLKSIVAQTVRSNEIIIIDDGSKDNTIKAALSLNIDNLKIIKQKNMGVSHARNQGIKNSSSQLVAFLDSDDEWLPNHLETLTNLTKWHPDANIWSSGFIHKNKESERIFRRSKELPETLNLHEYLVALVLNKDLVWTSATMVRRDAMLSLGAFNEGQCHGEDHEAWLKMIAYHDKLIVSDRVTAIYHQGSNGLSGALVTENDAVMCFIRELLAETSTVSQKNRKLLKRVFNKFSKAHALNCIRHSERQMARKFVCNMYVTSFFNIEKFILCSVTFLPIGIHKALLSVKRSLRW